METPSTGGGFRSSSRSSKRNRGKGGASAQASAVANIVITCRDGRVLRFGFTEAFHAPVSRVITQFAFPNKLAFLFAFYHWCVG